MVDFPALQPGIVGHARVEVNVMRLATEVGSGRAPVFASPMMIAVMEAACVNCIEAHLPEGYQSLGTHLNVSHIAPTPLGFSVIAEARLAEINGRKLTFNVFAHDGCETIGKGTHTRVIVDTPRFLARLAAKSLPRDAE